MSRSITGALCAVIASLGAAGALADDSTAGLNSGGIELRKTDGIEMRREDLYLSMRAVHAAFRFRNVTGRDIDTIVAFPVPDVNGAQMVMQTVDVPQMDPVNFMGFKTWVDGKPVKANIEQKAFDLDGVDRTADLRRIGLPLNPAAKGLHARLNNLPQAAKDELLRLKLIDQGYFEEGYKPSEGLRPLWRLKTTYWWRQVFPAGRDLRIEHRYVPSLSNANAGLEELADDELADMARKNCIDPAVLKRLAAKIHNQEAEPYLWLGLDYVLTSGANWRGPIRDFRLVVDNPDPKVILTYCAPGQRSPSPRRVVWRKRDFVPDEDLSVGFLLP
jgi:hypothetical protein